MDVATFAEIEEQFHSRIARIAWCTVATVDRKGRPRSRILHPIWEGATGWIATGPQSHKAKHLSANPHVSLSYWDPKHEQVYADCRAEWDNGVATKHRIWELYKSTPPPLGYDPGLFFKSAEDEAFGVLKLTPWRIEISGLADLPAGRQPMVWRA